MSQQGTGEPSFFYRIFRGLLEAGVDFTVVGGQACNLWAEAYEEACPDLIEHQPYTSLDVDVYSESQGVVAKAARQFQVEAICNDSGSPDTVMGSVNVDVGGTPIPVQFLNGAYGIRNAHQIVALSQELEVAEGLHLKIIHPVLLMQSKLAMVVRMDRGAYKLTQDLKHLRMAVLFTGAFILEQARADPRKAINWCKRVCRIAESSAGRHAFQKFNVQVERAVPAEGLKVLNVPKLDAYLERAYPDSIRRIEERRARAPLRAP